MTQLEFTNILLCIVGFIGALSVKQLLKMNTSLNEINVSIASMILNHDHLNEKHDELKERVKKVENKVFDCP